MKLQTFADIRNGLSKPIVAQPKQDFAQSSVVSFR